MCGITTIPLRRDRVHAPWPPCATGDALSASLALAFPGLLQFLRWVVCGYHPGTGRSSFATLVDLIIHSEYSEEQLRPLMQLSFKYLGLMVGGALLNGVAAVLLGRAGVHVINRIKRELFSHTLSLGAGLDRAAPRGTLVARIESDSQRLVNLCSTMAHAHPLNSGDADWCACRDCGY